mmetsp:Transcript_24608/g.50490  ORF Transcript_24608/g.50490 Transcript_24608/m.50490 type:complete len:215 (+) Transcript_24608:302-946(+)
MLGGEQRPAAVGIFPWVSELPGCWRCHGRPNRRESHGAPLHGSGGVADGGVWVRDLDRGAAVARASAVGCVAGAPVSNLHRFPFKLGAPRRARVCLYGARHGHHRGVFGRLALLGAAGGRVRLAGHTRGVRRVRFGVRSRVVRPCVPVPRCLPLHHRPRALVLEQSHQTRHRLPRLEESLEECRQQSGCVIARSRRCLKQTEKEKQQQWWWWQR